MILILLDKALMLLSLRNAVKQYNVSFILAELITEVKSEYLSHLNSLSLLDTIVYPQFESEIT